MEKHIDRRCMVVAALSPFFAPMGRAEDTPYPARPIKVIVPWATATPADVAARIVAEKMGPRLGKAVYVENRPGAAGTLAISDILRQPADGYTLYMLASASLVAPALFPTTAVDFTSAFEPVGQVEWSYNVLVTAPSKPYRSFKDLLDTLRKHPGDLTFGSGGNGTPPHLAGELLKREAGVDARHVPYQQITQAATDLMAGITDFMFLGAAVSTPFIKSGRLRALAVTRAARAEGLQDIPTITESGYPNFVVRPFDGLLARKGTPPHIIQKLNAGLQAALTEQSVKAALANVGMEVAPSTPQQFGQLIAAESDRWLTLARRAQIKVD